jgi:hypothetical protein
MNIRYLLSLATACFCALLLTPTVFAQTLQINGVNTTCTSWSLTPNAAAVNLVTVPAGCLTGGNTNAPSISSVSPAACVSAGAAITVNGQNLGSATSVSVGGQTVTPPFTSNTATAIQLTVPAAGSGSGLTVNTAAGSASTSFKVGGCTPPAIGTIALSSAPSVPVGTAPAGSKVFLGGSGLTGATVTVNSVNAPVSAGGTDTRIEITLPTSPASVIGLVNIVGTNSLGSSGGILFTTTAPVIGDVSVSGKVLGNPSKNPNEIPLAGDGGAGINAFDMATTRCLNSPTPTKSWQHNIDLVSYGSLAALDFIAMTSGQSLSYKFTTPAAPRTGTFQTEENTQVTTPPTMISVSETPCDFDTVKLQAPRNYCYSSILAVSNAIQYEITPTGAPSVLGNCGLKPNTTYYFNMRFLKPSGGTYIESCAAGALCGATLQTRLQ